ncbi:hypothetical protein N7488_005930 [Penicillium malachiteum]|nr:hypothetical protein N7488_005930 [Penicillium malachiteum]
MGPRRTHRKSRNGCPQCKARRLKCDERYPCTNCVKHAIHCEYTAPNEPQQGSASDYETVSVTPVSTASPVALPPMQPQIPSQPQGHPHMDPVSNLGKTSANPHLHQDGGVSEPERKPNLLGILPSDMQGPPIRDEDDWALDLELMHHWCTSTSSTIVAREDVRHVWRVIMPIEGYRSRYVMHGLLALAALHRASLNPNQQEKERYVKASAFHTNSGLTEFRELIAVPLNNRNWQPVFCFASMVNVILLATPVRLGVSKLPSPISNVVEMFANINGLQALMEPFLHFIRKTQLAPMVNSIWLVDPEIIPSPAQVSQSLLPPDIWVQASNLHRFIDSYTFSSMETQPTHGSAANPQSTNDSSDRRSHYKVALESFERACRSMELAGVNIERGMIFLFAHTLSKEFHQELEAHEPAALVILSHYCVLVQLVDDIWYMRGMASQLLDDIEKHIRPEFREWLAWPRQWVYERR